MKMFLRSRSGMSLLNVIILLMLAGILTTAGVKMMGPLIQRGKINDTKTSINSAVDAIISWSVSRGHLPGTAAEFAEASAQQYDTWGRKLRYLYDKNLIATSSTNTICNQTTTGLTINSTPNIAFAVLSLGDDYAAQSAWNSNTIASDDTKYLYPLHDGTNGAVNTASAISPDIYHIVTLDELKAKVGCFGQTGGRLRIVNNELPKGCEHTGTASLFADGGVPPYRWCINNNLTAAGFVVNNAITAPDCSAVPTGVWEAFATSPQTAILYSANPGSYAATIVLRDSQGNTTQRNYTLTVIAGGVCGGTPPPGIDQEFIHGSTLAFSGNTVNGENATIVLTGNLVKTDINGGADIGITNAYISGNVTLGGSQTLGSKTVPGTIYIEGDLDMSGSSEIYGKFIYVKGNITMNGSPLLGLSSDNSTVIKALGNITINNGSIHGDIYTNGNMYLKSATLYKNAYVGGNLELDWTPTLSSSTTIYYKGNRSAPGSFTASILAKCIQDTSLPVVAIPVTMPTTVIPPLKADSWYNSNGYLTNGALTNNAKIFSTGNYTANGSASNVIIASKGNVTIGSGSNVISGVIYAPNGSVSFGGDAFTGYVIAKDGFYVTRGGSTVTLKSISTYMPDSANYPFVHPYP